MQNALTTKMIIRTFPFYLLYMYWLSIRVCGNHQDEAKYSLHHGR